MFQCGNVRVKHAAKFLVPHACRFWFANLETNGQADSAHAPVPRCPKQGQALAAHPACGNTLARRAVLPGGPGSQEGLACRGSDRRNALHSARSSPQGSVGVARDYDGGNTTRFVSPAGDSLEGPIDLSEILDLRRPHRYPVRVKGDALAERGIQHGDILIADAAATPAAGRVVIAMIHGDVLVCQLAYRHGQWWLRPSGAGKEPLPVADEAEIWAVVAALVRTKI